MLTIDRRVRPSDAGFDHSQPDGGRLAAAGMTWIAGGTFQMARGLYPEERTAAARTASSSWSPPPPTPRWRWRRRAT